MSQDNEPKKEETPWTRQGFLERIRARRERPSPQSGASEAGSGLGPEISTPNAISRKGFLRAGGALTLAALAGKCTSEIHHHATNPFDGRVFTQDQHWLYLGKHGADHAHPDRLVSIPAPEDRQTPLGTVVDLQAELHWTNDHGDQAGQVTLEQPNQLPARYDTVVVGLGREIFATEQAIPAGCKELFLPQGVMQGSGRHLLSVSGEYELGANATRPDAVALTLEGTDRQGHPRQLGLNFAQPRALPNIYFYNDRHEIVGGISGRDLDWRVRETLPIERDLTLTRRVKDAAGQTHEYLPILLVEAEISDWFASKYREMQCKGTVGASETGSSVLYANDHAGLTRMMRQLGDAQARAEALEQGVVNRRATEKIGLGEAGVLSR